MKNISFLICCFFTIIFISCEKTITIKQQPYISKLSIQGLITPNTKPQIFLNRTVAYFDPKVNTRDLTVDNATVTLNDGSLTFVLRFDSIFNTHYCRYDYFYSNSNNIQTNKTYTLNIIFNGAAYTAFATTNQLKVTPTNITYIPTFTDLYGEHEGVVVRYTDIPNEENYYRYQMGRIIDTSVQNASNKLKSICAGNKKYYITEIGRTIYSDKNVDGQAVSFVFEPAYTHKTNDTAYIKLQTVDKNIFNFYDNLDKQKLAQYNPFVEPVFITQGQFKNAIGVFGAYAVSDSVLFIYPE